MQFIAAINEIQRQGHMQLELCTHVCHVRVGSLTSGPGAGCFQPTIFSLLHADNEKRFNCYLMFA